MKKSYILLLLVVHLCCYFNVIQPAVRTVYPDVHAQNIILNKLTGLSRVYKTLVFEKINIDPLDLPGGMVAVTVSDTNDFTLADLDDVTVFATKNEKAEIKASGTITGMTAALYKDLTLTSSSMEPGVTIDANVVINGSLTISAGGSLTVNGNLTVRGPLDIQSNGTDPALIVKGDILFDGDDLYAVNIAGIVRAQGVREVDGSSIRDGNIIIRNAASSTSEAVRIIANPAATGSLQATGSITIENNSVTGVTSYDAVVIEAPISTTYSSIVLARNRSESGNGVTIDDTVTAHEDVIMIDNSTTATDFSGVVLSGTATSSSGQVSICRNQGAGTNGYGAHVVTGGAVLAFKDVVIKDNTSDVTGFVNDGTLQTIAGLVIFQNNDGVVNSADFGTLAPAPSAVAGLDATMANDLGGNATITGGAGDGTGAGGNVVISGGTGGATNGNGGDVILQSEPGTGTGNAGNIFIKDQNQEINLISFVLHVLKAARIQPDTTMGDICFTNFNNAGISRARFDQEEITLTLDSDSGILNIATTTNFGMGITSGGSQRYIGDNMVTEITTQNFTVTIEWLASGKIAVKSMM